MVGIPELAANNFRSINYLMLVLENEYSQLMARSLSATCQEKLASVRAYSGILSQELYDLYNTRFMYDKAGDVSRLHTMGIWQKTMVEFDVLFPHIMDCEPYVPDFRWADFGALTYPIDNVINNEVSLFTCPNTISTEGCVPPISDGCKLGRDQYGVWYSTNRVTAPGAPFEWTAPPDIWSTVVNSVAGVLNSVTITPPFHGNVLYSITLPFGAPVQDVSTPIVVPRGCDSGTLRLYGALGSVTPLFIGVDLLFDAGIVDPSMYQIPRVNTGVFSVLYDAVGYVPIGAIRVRANISLMASPGANGGFYNMVAQSESGALIGVCSLQLNFPVDDGEAKGYDNNTAHRVDPGDCILGLGTPPNCGFSTAGLWGLFGALVGTWLLIVVVILLCVFEPTIANSAGSVGTITKQIAKAGPSLIDFNTYRSVLPTTFKTKGT